MNSTYSDRISKIAVEDYLLLTHHCFASDYSQLLIQIFTGVLQLSKKITKLLQENGAKQESCKSILLKISVKYFGFYISVLKTSYSISHKHRLPEESFMFGFCLAYLTFSICVKDTGRNRQNPS